MIKGIWVLLALFGLIVPAHGESRKHWDAGDWADYRREQARERSQAKNHNRRHREARGAKSHPRPSKGILGATVNPLEKVKEIIPRPMFGPNNVDDYLCEVYNRAPKVDSTGDFTWKDIKAAAKLKMVVCDYAIRGMHQDLREILFAFGQIADSHNINWTILSGFRDNYRQSIASGFKAGPCGSMHGGTCRTKGYGDGRAADLWASGSPNTLFILIDKLKEKFGLSRPMPGNDPAHVQLNGNSARIAQGLRRARLAALPFPF